MIPTASMKIKSNGRTTGSMGSDLDSSGFMDSSVVDTFAAAVVVAVAVVVVGTAVGMVPGGRFVDTGDGGSHVVFEVVSE